MSYLTDFIAQKRLILQQENQAFSQNKFAIEQQNLFENTALDGILSGLNQTQAFFQAEFAKQMEHKRDLQKIAHETRAKSILERLKNNAEINRAKLNAKLEIERMIAEKELQKDYLVFEKYCEIFFRLLEREVGLNTMELNAENIERYVAEAFSQMGMAE